MHILCSSTGFPSSWLTSVNNFQLVPIDSPAALSPLLLMSETDESGEENKRAGTEVLKHPQSRRDVAVGHQNSLAPRESGSSLRLYGFSGNPPRTLMREQKRVCFVFKSGLSSSSFFYSVSSLGFLFH